jgi:hypothetical protein
MTESRLVGFLCATVVVLLASGCGPTLVAQSTAPAGRVARLDPVNGFWGLQSYRMELSAGVAVALNCYRSSPCEHMDVRSDSTNVEVRKASIGTLERHPYGGRAIPASGFVVIGKQPGNAKIVVRTEGKTRVLAVTVIAPPQPSPPATVAR